MNVKLPNPSHLDHESFANISKWLKPCPQVYGSGSPIITIIMSSKLAHVKASIKRWRLWLELGLGLIIGKSKEWENDMWHANQLRLILWYDRIPSIICFTCSPKEDFQVSWFAIFIESSVLALPSSVSLSPIHFLVNIDKGDEKKDEPTIFWVYSKAKFYEKIMQVCPVRGLKTSRWT